LPSRGQSGIATVMEWNTLNNTFQSGNAAATVLWFVKDGVLTTPANQAAITEVSGSGGGPLGAYAIAFTSAEATCNTLWIGGQSSTANVAIIPITLTFEQLPLTLVSGFVQSTDFMIQANAIGTTAFVPGALTTSVFGAPFLTSASYDATYSNGLADALINRSSGVESGITPGLAWRYMAAGEGGVTAGALTPTFTIQAINNPATNRITATTDSSGNRLAVVLS
jgi:hypothetical protein